MSNPYLPKWEYIPDGEPRVFGNRVYVYGSHDRAGSSTFCDYKLKVWSASVDDLNRWVCHGDIFHTRPDRDHESDTDWTDCYLYAPDCVEKDGKYYLYAYIMGGKGCVAVSDKPEGPFELISPYVYTMSDKICCNGWFIDPGVLVDDDGRVYIYCGFERSFLAEVNAENMYEILDSSEIEHFIPNDDVPNGFFEACSPRKVGDTYYMIYSPKIGSRLDYMTSKSPTGPFEWQGTIVDNSVDYPGGNDHGSICNIKGQWYIFYHRMTNNSCMSRRACVEKIEMLEDGTIPQVEMTSLGFEDSLDPYAITPAEIACVLKGGCFVTEKNVFSRPITAIGWGAVMGYKYFDFGEDFSSKTIEFAMKVKGNGCACKVKIMLDSEDGEQIGECEIGADDGVYNAIVKSVTSRHAIYFVVEPCPHEGWVGTFFEHKHLFDFEEFVFMK